MRQNKFLPLSATFAALSLSLFIAGCSPNANHDNEDALANNGLSEENVESITQESVDRENFDRESIRTDFSLEEMQELRREILALSLIHI